jgi:hypothetical protein
MILKRFILILKQNFLYGRVWKQIYVKTYIPIFSIKKLIGGNHT